MSGEKAPAPESDKTKPVDYGIGVIVDLIGVMKDIMTDYEMDRCHLSGDRRNACVVAIEKYEDITERTEFSDHKVYFKRLYDRYRSEILNHDNDEEWIKRDVTVWYGIDVPKVKRMGIKLPISSVFVKAETLRLKAETEMDRINSRKELGHVDESEKIENDERRCNDAIFYSDEIIYYLLKIFQYTIVDDPDYEDDVPVLKKNIDKFAKILGIDENSSKRREGGGALGNIFKVVGNLAKASGIKGPNGENFGDAMNNVNDSQVNNVLQGFFTDPKIQSAVTNTLSGMNELANKDGPQDVGSMISNIFTSMNPVINEKISSMTKENPPDGVNDSRSQEQREMDAKKLQDSFGQMGKAVSGIAEHLGGVKNAAKTENIEKSTV